MRKIKTLTSYAAHCRFLAECGNQNFWMARRLLPVVTPYFYSPTKAVMQWQGKLVTIAETIHRRFEVWEIPKEIVHYTENAAESEQFADIRQAGNYFSGDAPFAGEMQRGKIMKTKPIRTGKDMAPLKWIDGGNGTLIHPVAHEPITTRVVNLSSYRRIFEVYDYYNEAERNFQLILGAPELLAALEEIATRGPVPGYDSASALRLRLVATQSIARAAIAKAKGLA
jgi:hypothetical protein